jgi:hypothetical protein
MKCCNCKKSPAHHYAYRPYKGDGSDDPAETRVVGYNAKHERILLMFFCDKCFDHETIQCRHCHADVDLDYVKSHPDMYQSPCPYCGGQLESTGDAEYDAEVEKYIAETNETDQEEQGDNNESSSM